MKKRICISKESPSVFIEYEQTSMYSIPASSVRVLVDEIYEKRLNTDYIKSILAYLILTKDEGGADVETLWEQALNMSDDPDYNIERTISEKIQSIRRILKEIIGETYDPYSLLPRRKKHGPFQIIIDNSMIENIESTKEVPSENIQFRTASDLHKLGLTNSEIATQLVNNDQKLYGFNPGSREEGSIEKWTQFIDEGPEWWGFLCNIQGENVDIVGNYSMVILSPKQRELLLKGDLYDGEIDLYDTYAFFPGNNYTLYLLNCSVNPAFNYPQYRTLLFDKLFYSLLECATIHHIFFKEIFFTSWRFRNVLAAYGFHPVLKKTDGSVILHMNFPDELRWEHAEEIKKVYCNLIV